MILESVYKGVQAIRVENHKLSALFLPQYGCRLASLKDKESGFEFLAQHPCPIFRPQTEKGIYVENDVSGCDDMFPTIDPITDASGRLYPCHGEVCRVAHSFVINSDSLTTFFRSQSLSYTFEKTIAFNHAGELEINVSIHNESTKEFPCLFAEHLMLTAEEGGYIDLPYPDGAPVEITFDEQKQFGKPGQKLPLQRKMLQPGPFSINGNAYKYYLLDPIPKGECRYLLPKRNLAFRLSYDNQLLPYFAIWVNNGSFQQQHTIAMEPCTAPFDSPDNASQRGKGFALPPNGTFAFTLRLAVEKADTIISD